MKTKRRFIRLFFLLCFTSVWYGCENDEICTEEISIPESIENCAAQLMLAQLQEDDKVFQEFKHSLSGNQPRYDLVQIITHSDFGLCYYIPYSPTGDSKIAGAIYLPSGAILSEDGTADFGGALGALVKVDAREINHEINITKRYLYSIPFKKLQKSCETLANQIEI